MYCMFLCLYIVLLTVAGVSWEAGDADSLSSGKFNKVPCHIHWCLIADSFQVHSKNVLKQSSKNLHFIIQWLLCYHNVRYVLVICGTNYK